MEYQPCPIDTSHIQLTDAHRELVELLAANTHELWARQRMGEGWKYGPYRNDHCLEHPGLVPYSDLTESEREYDRVTAEGVLKTLLALGYRIEHD